jgi:hypothetical protein
VAVIKRVVGGVGGEGRVSSCGKLGLLGVFSGSRSVLQIMHVLALNP